MSTKKEGAGEDVKISDKDTQHLPGQDNPEKITLKGRGDGGDGSQKFHPFEFLTSPAT